MTDSFDLSPLLGEADVLLIIPPFAGVDRPSLAAHTLQACARHSGFRVRVLYANLAFARHIGDTNYEGICFGDTTSLLGERFFARAAYGLPSFGRDDPEVKVALEDLSSAVQLDPDEFRRLEADVPSWCDALVEAIRVAGPFPIIGCSTTFEQTAASIAILERIKVAMPSTITLLGGANCEGEMAIGLRSLGTTIDYIFSGESEATFPRFLADVAAGARPDTPIIEGRPCLDMDALPDTDFTEYFEQRQHFLAESPYVADDTAWLPYESSRGCWWGQKHHCTFCGINGGGMQFREKSPDRVIGQLKALAAAWPIHRVCMVDNIMPFHYFRTLIPRLPEEVPPLYLFYEQKANLTLEHVSALRRAGVGRMQPGIEALSTSLLRHMDKGVTARQNVAVLRYARAVDMDVSWNLLYAFPGDRAEWYRETLDLIPLIRHLQPPEGVCHLSIDRFSPYHEQPARYGIESVFPIPSYAATLPPHADVDKIAYHFLGDYPSDSETETVLMRSLIDAVEAWRKAWDDEEKPYPALHVVRVAGDTFMIVDTRGIDGMPEMRFLTRAQAMAALVSAPMGSRSEEMDEALERGYGVERDGWFVSLATAPPSLFGDLEAEWEVRSRAMPPPAATTRTRFGATL